MSITMVTSATTGPTEGINDVGSSSSTIHHLTKRSPVDLGLFKKKIVPNPLKILNLKLGPLKKFPLALKKKVSLPIQKVIKTVPLALKKGLLPIAVPLALKNPLLVKKTLLSKGLLKKPLLLKMPVLLPKAKVAKVAAGCFFLNLIIYWSPISCPGGVIGSLIG